MSRRDGAPPALWLRELFRLHPAPLPVGASIRAAVCVAAPLVAGLASGRPDAALWVTLAALTIALGEGTGTYRSRLRQMAIALPFAVAGVLAGYLSALPDPALIVVMALLAALSGIVSSFGAAFSTGATQFLLFACFAIGLPAAGPPWQTALLYLLGAALFAAGLGLEALIDRRRPERAVLLRTLAALAALAEACAAAPASAGETAAVEAARREATDAALALVALVAEVRSNGRTREAAALSGTLDAADILFADILAATDPQDLRAAARWLRALAGALARRHAAPPLPAPAGGGDGLRPGLAGLAASLRAPGPGRRDRGDEGDRGDRAQASVRPPLLDAVRTRLIVGRAVLREAVALGLCMGLAFATRSLGHDAHWYWVPLTVAIVMKPDLGSIFVRAVHRAVGTSLGVVIGAVLLVVLPKGALLIAALSLLAALLPWARLVSYAAQTLVLTPLVLVLLDQLSPAPGTADLGAQRLADTLIGGAIVLVFGYFIWPQHRSDRLAGDFAIARQRLADYLEAVCLPPATGAAGDAGRRAAIAGARRAAYGALSNLRVALARSTAEPPPAGREAAAWVPVVASAERICDRITARDADRGPGPGPTAADVRRAADRIRQIGAPARQAGLRPDEANPPADPFLAAVAAETRLLAERLRDGQPEPAVTGLEAGPLRQTGS